LVLSFLFFPNPCLLSKSDIVDDDECEGDDDYQSTHAEAEECEKKQAIIRRSGIILRRSSFFHRWIEVLDGQSEVLENKCFRTSALNNRVGLGIRAPPLAEAISRAAGGI
jgi:hypothetical protein